MEHLIRSHYQYLNSFAFFLTKHNEQSKDLFQDTVLRILIHQDKFKAGTNFKAWASTIMKNIFINLYRKRKKSPTVFALELKDYIVRSKTTGSTCDQNLRIEEIKKSVKRLPEKLRIPLFMLNEGYKYNEISDELDVPLGTIKSRIHIARNILKPQIELDNSLV